MTKNPQIAVARLRDKLLRHQSARAAAQCFENDRQVAIVGGRIKNAAPAHAVQRLNNRAAVLAVKSRYLRRVRRNQSRRNPARMAKNRGLFVFAQQRARRIENPRPARFGVRQHARGGGESRIDRRLFAHPNRVERFERRGRGRALLFPFEPVFVVVGNRRRPRARENALRSLRQIGDRRQKNLDARRRRRPRQRDGRIFFRQQSARRIDQKTKAPHRRKIQNRLPRGERRCAARSID